MQPNACTIRKVNEDMTQDPERSRRSDLPPEVLEIILPGLQVGGASGMFIASVMKEGILHNGSPLLSGFLGLFTRDHHLIVTKC